MSDDVHESQYGAPKVDNSAPAMALPHKRLFKTIELRLFRYTAVLFSLVALTALIGIILWAFGWVLETFNNLLLSLSLAGILALVLDPVVKLLEARLRLSRLLAVILLLVVFFLAISGLIFLFVPTLVGQVVQLIADLPETLARWEEYLTYYFPGLSSMIETRLEGNGEGEGGSESVLPALQAQGTNIMSYLGILASISFVPLFLFFALLAGDSLRGQVSELLSVFNEATRKKVLYFVDVFVEYITAFFQGQLIIAGFMGGLYALGFTLIGLQFGVLIGLILGLLNIVPFLGTLVGILVVLPLAYFQTEGGVELLLLSGFVFAVVQVVESWILTPKIMANRSGLHPALVVISLFFWGTALDGLIGMLLAVPLTAFIVAIWSEIKASIKRTLNSQDQEPL